MQASIDYIGVGTGGVLVNTNDAVLLLKRAKSPEAGAWSIPGGAIEYGEKAENAVVREMQEEVGLACYVVHYLGYYDYILPVEHCHWISFFYVVKTKEHIQPKNREPQKHLQMQWFDLDKLPEHLTANTIQAINLYKEWMRINRKI